jgi:hypothetical protein
MFVDESERQNKKDRAYFTLCGLIVDATKIIKLERALEDFRKNHQINNLKDLRKSGLPEDTRIAASRELSTILESNECQMIAAVLGSSSLKSNHVLMNVHTRYSDTLDFIVERFFLYLRNHNDEGMIFMDKVESNAEHYLREYFFGKICDEPYYYFDKVFRYSDRIYPSLNFSDDKRSGILQLTDSIAAPLNASIYSAILEHKRSGKEWGLEELPNYNKFLEVYWKIFNRSKDGRVAGYGIKWWD